MNRINTLMLREPQIQMKLSKLAFSNFQLFQLLRALVILEMRLEKPEALTRKSAASEDKIVLSFSQGGK